MDNLSPYRFTVIGSVLVLVLSVGVVTVLGGPSNAAAYLGLVATVAVPGLLGLFKLEQNTAKISALHEQNQADLAATNSKLDDLATLAATLPIVTTPPPTMTPPGPPTLGGTH